MRHKLVCILCQLTPGFHVHVVWTRWNTLVYPEGRLWRFKPPSSNLHIFLNCIYTKILSKLCYCIYEIQQFCTGKRKKMCTLFSHFVSVSELFPWTQLGVLTFIILIDVTKASYAQNGDVNIWPYICSNSLTSLHPMYTEFRGFTIIIRYYPTQAFNRTKSKCSNKCWIDFIQYSFGDGIC